jgi:hypothetical protein
MMQFTGSIPSVPVRKQADLEKYDDPEFDAEAMSHQVPQRFLALLTYSLESLVFRTICGVPVPPLSKPGRSRLLLELRKCLNLCVEGGLIGEASYMQYIIEGVRINSSPAKSDSLERVTEKLSVAEEQLERRKNR